MAPQSLQMLVSSNALVCKVVGMRCRHKECVSKIISTMLCQVLIGLCLGVWTAACSFCSLTPGHFKIMTIIMGLLAEVVIAPTSLHIARAQQKLQNKGIKISAQNAWVKGNGAYTGEIR